MSAGTYNFTIEQGATLIREFVYKGSNGAAIDLTGYSARMQIRQYKESSTVLVEATTTNGKMTVTPLLGKITLTLSASDTDSLAFDLAVYDLEVESGGGVVTRLIEGTVSVSKQVTR